MKPLIQSTSQIIQYVKSQMKQGEMA